MELLVSYSMLTPIVPPLNHIVYLQNSKSTDLHHLTVSKLL